MNIRTHLKLLAIAALTALPHWHASAAEDRPMHIRHAVEVEVETERGRGYQLQRSTNMVDWQAVEDTVYGHGGRESRLYSTKQEDKGIQEYYRVVIVDVPTNGLAPWNVTGLTINLDNSPSGDHLQFLTDTNGVKSGVTPDPFIYTFTRTGTNEVRIETHPPTYYFDRRSVYTFTFTAPDHGTWIRDEFRKGKLKDRDVGVFSIPGLAGQGTGGTNPPPVVPTEIPTALTGLAYTFQSGESPDRLEFTTATSGTEFGDDATDDSLDRFTYTHSLDTTNTASVVVTFKPGRWDEYALTYDTAAGGTYMRKKFQDGVLVKTVRGAFSVVVMPPVDPGSGGSGGGGSGSMPTGSSLAGLIYTMDDGSTHVVKLVVESAAEGTQLDDSAPTSFTYTYAVAGASTANLVVRFKADKWDEYDLTFNNGANNGSFARRRFDKNELKDTSTGTFTGAPTAP